jgi:hypothetical protein
MTATARWVCAASDLGLSLGESGSEPEGDESGSRFGGAAGAESADLPGDVGEVVAVDTQPPVLKGHPGETIAILSDQGPPKDEEIDDLFVDLVEVP